MTVEAKRGEIGTVSDGPGYAGKPRPAVIVQDDLFAQVQSITLCGLTTELSESPLARPLIEPHPKKGLRTPSRIMIDKITTIARSRLDRRTGRLAPDEMARVDDALVVFLGLAG